MEKVLLNKFSWEVFSFIISIVGFSVKFYLEISLCINLEVVKVFVKGYVFKVLLGEIIFLKGGSEFIVNYYYLWFLLLCKLCEKWGYNEFVCRMKEKGGSKGVE